MDVGFVGVGRMGSVMVANLTRAGHRVCAWDVSPAAVGAAAQSGAEAAGSARQAFAGDAVISMLPNDEAMRAVFLADGMPPQGARTIHVNMATASIACTDELAATHKARGVPYVSATVFGRPEMAAERNLMSWRQAIPRRSTAYSRCSMPWARRPGGSATSRASRTSRRSPAI